MRTLLIVALLMTPAGVSASPPSASDFAAPQQARAGGFAGLQLSMPLGGADRDRQVRAAATIAPTLQIRDLAGATTTRVGEGAAFSLRADGRLSFSLAGQDLKRNRFGTKLGADKTGGGGLPTWALVLGGLAASAGVGYLVLQEALDCDSGSECN